MAGGGRSGWEDKGREGETEREAKCINMTHVPEISILL